MYILLLLLILSLIDCSSNYQNPIKVKSYVTYVNSLVFPLKFSDRCKAQPHRALLGYPFQNTAAHMEAMPTREGI